MREIEELIQRAQAMDDEEQKLFVMYFKLENVLAALNARVLAQQDRLKEIIEVVNEHK